MTLDRSEIAVKAEIKNAVQGYTLSLPHHKPDTIARIVLEAVLRLSHDVDGTVKDETPIQEIDSFSLEQVSEWALEAVISAKESLSPERRSNEMTKRYIKICDAFATGRVVEMGTKLEIFKGKEHDDNRVELENGIWINGTGDGCYTTDENEFERWATVQIIEEDEDGEIVGAEYLGYTRI